MFDWDDSNLGHVDRHGVEPDEAEQAILDPDRVSASAYNVAGERRWALIGATEGGRLLFVVYTRRGSLIRVVSARGATDQNKRQYRRRGK